MAVRDDRSDVKQTTTGFRDPRHHICQKQIPIPGLERLLPERDKFEDVDVERHPCSFLYFDGSRWHFMDDVSFDQFDLGPEELGDSKGFLVEGIEDMEAMYVDGTLAGVELPNTVDLVITDTTPPIKGATAAAQLKSATLETGVEVQVPPYLTSGERVRIDTRDGHFVERVK